MAKRLTRDGERREIHAAPRMRTLMARRVRVVAHRLDSDTPVVELTVYGPCGSHCKVWLEDIAAEELKRMLGRSLAILPSSK